MLLKKIFILSAIFLFTSVCILAGELGLGNGQATVSRLQDLKLGIAESAIKNSSLFSSMWTKRQFEDPRIYESKVKGDSIYYAFCRDGKCVSIEISLTNNYLEKEEALALARVAFPFDVGPSLESEDPDFQNETKTACQYFYWKDFGCELTYFSRTKNVCKIRCWTRA